MSARDDILARLRGPLDAATPPEKRSRAAAERLAAPVRVAAPGRVRDVDLVEAFLARAAEVGATTARVGRSGIGTAVADYLRARSLPMFAKASPELAALQIPWPAALTVTAGGATENDLIGI